MLGPKCNNGFITFRTNGLLHLGPNFITFRTFITFKTNLFITFRTFITFKTKFLLHLGPLLHLGTFITFEASTDLSPYIHTDTSLQTIKSLNKFKEECFRNIYVVEMRSTNQ